MNVTNTTNNEIILLLHRSSMPYATRVSKVLVRKLIEPPCLPLLQLLSLALSLGIAGSTISRRNALRFSELWTRGRCFLGLGLCGLEREH